MVKKYFTIFVFIFCATAVFAGAEFHPLRAGAFIGPAVSSTEMTAAYGVIFSSSFSWKPQDEHIAGKIIEITGQITNIKFKWEKSQSNHYGAALFRFGSSLDNDRDVYFFTGIGMDFFKEKNKNRIEYLRGFITDIGLGSRFVSGDFYFFFHKLGDPWSGALVLRLTMDII
ncbi:MAG: hypothetical protein HYW78_00735 [Parcubacteria group bacterium]|nr:hypothetical protein [Parcubacteria group bacterium]